MGQVIPTLHLSVLADISPLEQLKPKQNRFCIKNEKHEIFPYLKQYGQNLTFRAINALRREVSSGRGSGAVAGIVGQWQG